MVASAQRVGPGRASGAQYELVPALEVRRIAAAYREPFFLPKRLPSGFIFSQWQFEPHDYDTGGRRSVFVTFGRDGLVLVWGVHTGVDRFGNDCPDKLSRIARDHVRLINGRRVFFRAGVQGASAWTCVPAHAAGNMSPVEINLWYDIRLESSAVRRLATRMVATARLVRPR
jgi:hypothetical protein